MPFAIPLDCSLCRDIRKVIFRVQETILQGSFSKIVPQVNKFSWDCQGSLFIKQLTTLCKRILLLHVYTVMKWPAWLRSAPTSRPFLTRAVLSFTSALLWSVCETNFQPILTLLDWCIEVTIRDQQNRNSGLCVGIYICCTVSLCSLSHLFMVTNPEDTNKDGDREKHNTYKPSLLSAVLTFPGSVLVASSSLPGIWAPWAANKTQQGDVSVVN